MMMDIPVAEKDRHKTAIATPFEAFQFKVMPFGLKLQLFQQPMDRLLQGCEEFAAAYIDDFSCYL